MAIYKSLFKPVLVITIIILFFLILIFAGEKFFEKIYKFPQKITYGVTFSHSYAKYLGLDWKKTFVEMIGELGVKDIRLPTYWSNLEPEKSKFNFSETDFMIDVAEKKGAKIILVLGFRQPRWPECHWPDWVKSMDLPNRQRETLKFISAVLDRYKDRKSVWAFQVENEPFLPFFGQNCPAPDSKFLKAEVELVRSLTNKPIIISDSGEFGLFIIPMQLSDIFGTTLYRRSYDAIFGYKTYPVLPYLYNLKSSVARIFAANNQKTIVVELQAEPWLADGQLNTIPNRQVEIFPPDELKNYISYFKKTGFDTAYLWGVEWWYFMEKQGYPQYLEYAKTLFQ